MNYRRIFVINKKIQNNLMAVPSQKMERNKIIRKLSNKHNTMLRKKSCIKDYIE